jgi:hypothetical protein
MVQDEHQNQHQNPPPLVTHKLSVHNTINHISFFLPKGKISSLHVADKKCTYNPLEFVEFGILKHWCKGNVVVLYQWWTLIFVLHNELLGAILQAWQHTHWTRASQLYYIFCYLLIFSYLPNTFFCTFMVTCRLNIITMSHHFYVP